MAASTEQTATHATGTCALSVPLLRCSFAISFNGFLFFPAERADVLLGVLRKTLPKATVVGGCSLGAVGNALAGDGDLKTSSTNETKWRANDGGHDGHLADDVRPHQPCVAAG